MLDCLDQRVIDAGWLDHSHTLLAWLDQTLDRANLLEDRLGRQVTARSLRRNSRSLS